MTEGYGMLFAPAFERELRKIKDRTVLKRIQKAINGLRNTPRPSNVDKLTDMPNLWRLKVGNFRITYKIEDNKVVILLMVRDRKDAYRDMGTLIKRIESVDKDLLAKELQNFR